MTTLNRIGRVAENIRLHVTFKFAQVLCWRYLTRCCAMIRYTSHERVREADVAAEEVMWESSTGPS